MQTMANFEEEKNGFHPFFFKFLNGRADLPPPRIYRNSGSLGQLGLRHGVKKASIGKSLAISGLHVIQKIVLRGGLNKPGKLPNFVG